MANNGRWAAALMKQYGASMSGDVTGALEDLPHWIGDLGEPVDDLRRVVEMLTAGLSAAVERAEKAEALAEEWERKHDAMGDDATDMENQRDEARRERDEALAELAEVRNG